MGENIMEKITYEVKGYMTVKDFDDTNYILIDEYIPTKDEAMEIAREVLGEYEVVKMQSHDREEIVILRVHEREF